MGRISKWRKNKQNEMPSREMMNRLVWQEVSKRVEKPKRRAQAGVMDGKEKGRDGFRAEEHPEI